MTSTPPPAEPDGQVPGALAGVRVVDFSQLVSGPLCTTLLADLGAEVIKVESPHAPDPMRHAGAASEGQAPPSFHTVNRNKRSVTADLKRDDDLARIRALIDEADVVVENFRPGVADRLGIGFEAVRVGNPRLVYASLSGFGEIGPVAGVGGYDILAQAMSGIMSVTGHADGEPLKAGVPVTDVAAGLYLAVGVIAALRASERDGVGQRVTTSLLGAGLAFGVWEAAEWWAHGEVPQRLGNVHRSLAPYQVIRAGDGSSLVVAANSDRMFRAACEALGCAALADDERFSTNAGRIANRPALVELIEARTAVRPAAEWVDRLTAAAVPACEVLDYQQALEHEQTRAIGMVVDIDDGHGGTVTVLGNPLSLSRTPVAYRHPGPDLEVVVRPARPSAIG